MANDAETPNDESVLTTVAKAVGTTAGMIVAKATQLSAEAASVVKKVKSGAAPRKARKTAKKRTARAATKRPTKKTASPKKKARKPAARKRAR